jgi:hypothetical protein
MIIDSGATNHIISSLNLLVNNSNGGALSSIIIPNGEQVSIAFIGSLPLSYTIVLTNMLRIPSFKVDLIYVSRLTKDLNCLVTYFFIGVFYKTW